MFLPNTVYIEDFCRGSLLLQTLGHYSETLLSSFITVSHIFLKNQKTVIYFWKKNYKIYYGICGPQFIQIFFCCWTLKLFSNKVTNQKWLPLTKLCYKSKRTVNQLSENSLLPERFLIVPSLSVVKIIITLNNFSVRGNCVI